jgi:predicted house-cleaning noncanonical NTP pyrophosphatase (MazG superfamily)
MTNNKQQTAVEWLEKQTRKPEWHSLKRGDIFEQAKEKYEHEMCEFAAEYAQYELQQNKPGIKGAMVSMCAWTFFKNRRK